MDINGAKALKERLGRKGTDHTPPAPAEVHVSEDAPPVYQWFGVARQAPREAEDDQSTTVRTSLFSRLGLSFR
jgi:hypothetical protein